jgi:hypothetical protein
MSFMTYTLLLSHPNSSSTLISLAMSSTNSFDFGPYDHSDRDPSLVRSSSNNSDGLATRMGALSVYSESPSDGPVPMMKIGARNTSSTVGDPCRRAEDFHLSTWRPLNKMSQVESATFCMTSHPLMNYCFIHLRHHGRNMLVWHGPARLAFFDSSCH